MKLIYYPDQKYSVLKIENSDDIEVYDIVKKYMTIQAPDAMYRGYKFKCFKQKKEALWDGKISFLDESLFGSGLFFIVKNILNKLEAKYTEKIYYKSISKLEINNKILDSLRPLQLEMVKDLVNHSKKYKFIRKIYNVPIGSGKSYFIENLPNIFVGTTTLLIVESLSLYNQYITVDTVNSVSKNGIVNNKVNIMMANYYNKNHFEIEHSLKNIDFLILDEVHLKDVKSISEKYPLWYLKQGLIGFTATLPDDKLSRINLYSFVSASVFKKEYNEVYRFSPTIRIIVNNTKIQCLNRFSYSEISNMVYKDKSRLKLILKIINKHKKNRVLLIMSKVTKGMSYIAKFLKDNNIKYNKIHGTVKSEDRKKILNDFETGKVKVLLASGVVKAGINIDYADVLVFLAQHKNSIPVTQYIGRLIRGNNPNIEKKYFYDFYDKNYPYFNNQLRCRLKIYMGYGWKIQKDSL